MKRLAHGRNLNRQRENAYLASLMEMESVPLPCDCDKCAEALALHPAVADALASLSGAAPKPGAPSPKVVEQFLKGCKGDGKKVTVRLEPSTAAAADIASLHHPCHICRRRSFLTVGSTDPTGGARPDHLLLVA